MPVFKRSFFILLAIAAAALGVTALTLPPESATISLDEATAPEEAVAVYVTGAVRSPGVVRLTAGDRVERAIAACGGALPTADLSGVNLAQVAADGSQIRVPEKAAAKAALGAAEARPEGAATSDRILINSADEKALDSLPGIGPVMAKRIVEYRSKYGAFQKPEDLKKVRGIGDATFEKLKDRIAL